MMISLTQSYNLTKQHYKSFLASRTTKGLYLIYKRPLLPVTENVSRMQSLSPPPNLPTTTTQARIPPIYPEGFHQTQRDAFFRNANAYDQLPHPQKNHTLMITDGREYKKSPINKNSISIPIPPPMPSKPALKNAVLSDPITPISLQNAKKILKPTINALTENVLAAKIQNTPDIFKSLSTKIQYIPIISEEKDVTNFTDQQILDFLLERGLLANKEKTNVVEILAQGYGKFLVGVRKNNLKLTGYGSRYHNKILTKRYENNAVEHLPIQYNEDPNIVFPINGQPDLVETGGLTHLAQGYIYEGYCYLSGMYTSATKNGYKNLSPVKYKDYENQKENFVEDSNIVKKDGPQFFVPYKCLQKLPLSEVKIVKWGRAYLDFIKKNAYFKKILNDQKDLPCIPFNNIGVTKQEGLDMCLDMDYNIAKGHKHPQTLDQEANMLAKYLPKTDEFTH